MKRCGKPISAKLRHVRRKLFIVLGDEECAKMSSTSSTGKLATIAGQSSGSVGVKQATD